MSGPPQKRIHQKLSPLIGNLFGKNGYSLNVQLIMEFISREPLFAAAGLIAEPQQRWSSSPLLIHLFPIPLGVLGIKHVTDPGQQHNDPLNTMGLNYVDAPTLILTVFHNQIGGQ
jgi:hypothetical protein